jgi:hypothetical protein
MERLKSPFGSGGLPFYDAIISANCRDITRNILNKKWTCIEVVSVYCHKALREINCLTELIFDRALKKAAELDAEYALTGKARRAQILYMDVL